LMLPCLIKSQHRQMSWYCWLVLKKSQLNFFPPIPPVFKKEVLRKSFSIPLNAFIECGQSKFWDYRRTGCCKWPHFVNLLGEIRGFFSGNQNFIRIFLIFVVKYKEFKTLLLFFLIVYHSNKISNIRITLYCSFFLE